MAFLEFKNVRIAGISAGVPKKKICNLDLKDLSKDYDAAAFPDYEKQSENIIEEFLLWS